MRLVKCWNTSPYLPPDSGTARISSGVVKIRTQKSSTVHCLVSLVMLTWQMALSCISIRGLRYTALILASCGGRLSGARYESYPYIGQHAHTFPPYTAPAAIHHSTLLNLSVSRMLQYKRRESLETQLPIKGEYCVDPGVSLLITKARCNV